MVAVQVKKVLLVLDKLLKHQDSSQVSGLLEEGAEGSCPSQTNQKNLKETKIQVEIPK